MPHCFWQLPTAQCCCANQADSRLGPLQIHIGRIAVGIGVKCQQQISLRVFAVAQACCQPLLHSSTEQGAIANSSVALPCCWVTAHLYQQQISLSVFAVSQACCQLVLHSSTEQGAIAKSSVALHCCWVTAHLYQQQFSLCVFAVAQACCQPGLHSSTEQ